MVIHEAHVLECRNLSNVRTLSPNKWYSRFYSPSVTAQFLKNVSIIVRSGEIHGIAGNAGSGKTTLLKLIADRCGGECRGEIILNQHPLRRNIFNNVCSFVDFHQCLIPYFTAKTLLNFHAKLTVCGLTSAEKDERITILLREFDLLQYSNVSVEKFSESARRRLILCMHLLRDPVLLLLDEPTKGLDALSGYQLMYSLSSYLKRTQQMAVIAMRCPRSDLYQLLTRITILFYGEVLYSGFTKELPLYFRQVGYPCPCDENPAVYYLSLATIDRETTERYRETQEQAVKLVELFRDGSDAELCQPTLEPLRPLTFQHPICFFGRPYILSRFMVLSWRYFTAFYSSQYPLLLRILSLPICIFIINLLTVQYYVDNWHVPHNIASTFVIYTMCLSYVAIFITVHQSKLRIQSANEIADGVYHETVELLAFLFASLPYDLISFSLSIFVVLKFCAHIFKNWSFRTLIVPLWCCHQYSQLLTCFALVLSGNSDCLPAVLFSFSTVSIICAGSFFFAPRTFFVGLDWHNYLTYTDFYRYFLTYLNRIFIQSISTGGCSPNERDEIDSAPLKQFCRWENGSSYLSELYSDWWSYMDGSFNFYCTTIYIVLLIIVGLLCCCIADRDNTTDKLN